MEKNFYQEIKHPAHVSASIKDMRYILDNFWEKGYYDDHDPHGALHRIKINDQVVALGIWTNYRAVQIIPIYKCTFCANPLYVKDGEIHLDTCSCGGTVIGGNVDRFNHEMSPNNTERPYGYGEHIDVFTKEGWEKVKDSPIFSLFK